MPSLNLSRRLFAQPSSRRSKSKLRKFPGFERLEDRRVLTTFVDGFDLTPDAGGCGTFANPCNDIQTGVDNAPAGGEVYVAGGFYAENITFSKDLRIRGEAAR